MAEKASPFGVVSLWRNPTQAEIDTGIHPAERMVLDTTSPWSGDGRILTTDKLEAERIATMLRSVGVSARSSEEAPYTYSQWLSHYAEKLIEAGRNQGRAESKA